ncbi:sulfate transporter family-domain-containing protein [Xylariales sp. PMI_506]|nr:sulfate transporter family-domain-containing protein [Xylariales sp. PMI_506]
MPSQSGVGHVLAKVFRIDLETRDEAVTRGESVVSTNTTDSFIEEEPRTIDFVHEVIPTGHDVVDYLKSLFPFLSWIGFYNWQWLIGDLVAGITIGAVVVPQGMAYAKLANLPVQFGLYSSFMGVLIYWFFATSKDITIGPVAVMSTVTGNVVTKSIAQLPQYADTPWVIASALAIIAGAIVFFIGIVRWGRIVELIPLVSLASFMTGSALNILVGQVPTLLGETFPKPYTSRDPTYLVIINSLKYLKTAKLDAALGLTALVWLYGIRFTCDTLAKKYPQRQKLYFFINTLRTVFVILLYTLISWLVNMWHKTTPSFTILSTVPRGFTHASVPIVNTEIISSFVSELPASVIVLLIEHVAISKSFGRVNNYTINPSQEMVAIGVTNLLGPFLGGYPSTGSFSRTAIKSKAGVRTPLAGVITAIVVLLAIYALPAVFFYIPSAALSAVIIHAVVDLITPPQTLYKFWRVSPFEVFIWFVGVLVTIFTSIENGIYCTICISFAVLVLRSLSNRGRFLGRVQVQSVLGDQIIGSNNTSQGEQAVVKGTAGFPSTRDIFLPIGHGDGSNPELNVSNPYPGIFIYRFSEGFNYPNASRTLEYLVSHIFANTRRTNINSYPRKGDRPWNDPGPKKGDIEDSSLPTLKAVILDFSCVNNVDGTSVQNLIDVRNQLDRYTTPEVIDWHFAYINNRWTKRALVSAGFGTPTDRPEGLQKRWQAIFSVAEIGGDSSAAAVAENEANEKELHHTRAGVVDPQDAIERGTGASSSASDSVKNGKAGHVGKRRVAVHGINRPLFHIDLTSALQSAIANVEHRAQPVDEPLPEVAV